MDQQLKISSLRENRRLFAVIAASFFLWNDLFSFLDLPFWIWWLFDVGIRLTALGVIWRMVPKELLRLPTLDSPAKVKQMLLALLGVVAVGLLLSRYHHFFVTLTGFKPFAQIPHPSNLLQAFVDLTVGLGLVVFSEEVIFRGMWSKAALGKVYAFDWILSVALFSLGHWSGGGVSMLLTIPTGILFLWTVQRFQNLWIAMCAHYIIDLFIFGQQYWSLLK